MILRSICLLIVLFVLSGCATASLKTTEYNPDTKVYEDVKYSSHFEGEDFLISDLVRVLAYAEIHNRLGKDALVKSSEEWETADFTVYLSNRTEKNINLRVNSILFMNNYFSDRFISDAQEFVLVPDTVERIQVLGRKVDRSDKVIKLLIDFTYGQHNQVKEVELKRLTVREYRSKKPKLFSFF